MSSFIAIVSHKEENTLNLFQLKFHSTPKLRWVAATDKRLSQTLIDEFLILKNNHKSRNTCNSITSKLTCINKRRTYGIVVML